MKFKDGLKKQILLLLGTVICVLLLAGHTAAEEENTKKDGAETKWRYATINRDFKNPERSETIATVMEVNTDEFYIVIAEKKYYVAKFKIDGKSYQTKLINLYGEKVDMDAFSERNPVKVIAIELDPTADKYIALEIELLPPQ